MKKLIFLLCYIIISTNSWCQCKQAKRESQPLNVSCYVITDTIKAKVVLINGHSVDTAGGSGSGCVNDTTECANIIATTSFTLGSNKITSFVNAGIITSIINFRYDTLINNQSDTIAYFAWAADSSASSVINFSIISGDGTNRQTVNGYINVNIIKNTSLIDSSHIVVTTVATSGTIVVTHSLIATTGGFYLLMNSNSSLSTTYMYCVYGIIERKGFYQITQK